mmetsp:Transcript_7835/g.17670  ORF Transcript_7835/g.17670 Transcript_7835/m.17670 type:complete len:82 (+) Transcript_7835:262-507(+)
MEISMVLVAPRCNTCWSSEFPLPLDVVRASAKFQRKQQMLEVVCLRKMIVLMHILIFAETCSIYPSSRFQMKSDHLCGSLS